MTNTNNLPAALLSKRLEWSTTTDRIVAMRRSTVTGEFVPCESRDVVMVDCDDANDVYTFEDAMGGRYIDHPAFGISASNDLAMADRGRFDRRASK